MTDTDWDFDAFPAWQPPAPHPPPPPPIDAPLLLTPDMIVPPGTAAPADAHIRLADPVRQVAHATDATLALLAAETQEAAAALPAQLARVRRRPAAPRATAPRLRPARGAALALLLHAAVLALLILRLHSRPLAPPPDAQIVSLMMTTEATPGAAPQPAKPATPPPPAPAIPKPAPAAPPTPPIPTILKPADLPAPTVVRTVPRRTAPPQPSPSPTQTAARAQPAPRAAFSAAANILARPDSNSTNARPDYPLTSRQLGEQGVVLLSVEVLPDGSVGRVSIEVSTGFPRLDDAAREALLHWRFHPALKNGVPVTSTIPYYFDYSLN